MFLADTGHQISNRVRIKKMKSKEMRDEGGQSFNI